MENQVLKGQIRYCQVSDRMYEVIAIGKYTTLTETLDKITMKPKTNSNHGGLIHNQTSPDVIEALTSRPNHNAYWYMDITTMSKHTLIRSATPVSYEEFVK